MRNLWLQNGQTSVLKKHTESVHKWIMEFECNICDYKASSNSSLKKHIASVHYGSTGCRVFKQGVQN